MVRFRLSSLARTDLAHILATSAERWGPEGKRRYAAALAAGMRKVAADPEGPTTRTREDLSRGIRSFHLQNSSAGEARSRVRRPAHVLYYRVVAPGLVEIARILHERMDPSRHIETGPED